MTLARHLAGLGLALGLAALAWLAWDAWGQIQRVDQWTGLEAVRPARPWLAVLKLPLLAVAFALLFTLTERLTARIGAALAFALIGLPAIGLAAYRDLWPLLFPG